MAQAQVALLEGLDPQELEVRFNGKTIRAGNILETMVMLAGIAKRHGTLKLEMTDLFGIYPKTGHGDEVIIIAQPVEFGSVTFVHDGKVLDHLNLFRVYSELRQAVIRRGWVTLRMFMPYVSPALQEYFDLGFKAEGASRSKQAAVKRHKR